MTISLEAAAEIAPTVSQIFKRRSDGRKIYKFNNAMTFIAIRHEGQYLLRSTNHLAEGAEKFANLGDYKTLTEAREVVRDHVIHHLFFGF
jgi:hypothetical protein